MFCGSQVQAQLNWVLSSGPQKVVIKVSAGAVVSSGSWTGEESTSKLAQAVGRIHFLTIGPRAQDSNWLSTGSHPQLLKASPSFLLHGPPPPASMADHFFKSSEKERVSRASLPARQSFIL